MVGTSPSLSRGFLDGGCYYTSLDSGIAIFPMTDGSSTVCLVDRTEGDNWLHTPIFTARTDVLAPIFTRLEFLMASAGMDVTRGVLVN